MPDVRTLPIDAEHREFIVKAGGEVVSREHQLVAVTVNTSANRIASARLAYVDGAASTGAFALGDSALFVPGQRVEILAGTGADPTSVFIGTVVRVGLRVRESAASQWVVDCRHAAMKLAVSPRCADYFDQADSDIIAAVLEAAAVDAEIEATSLRHEQVLQFHATDWDFVLARARANGQLVWCEGEKVLVRRPRTDAAPVCTLQHGATLLEFEGEIDARRQHPSIGVTSWDPAEQETVAVHAAAPPLSAPGNLSAEALAGVSGQPLQLRHPALPESEAQAWADGEALRRRIDQVCGRAKCAGIATVRPGVVVALAGLGERFSGKVFVSAVRHEFSLVQGWKTHIQFGGIEPDPRPAPGAESAARAPLPALGGLSIGIVTSNADPAGEHRVRVRLPVLGLSGDGIWARVASLDAGKDRGFLFRPDIGDEVAVGFLGDDPRHPVVLGMLHSSAKPAPLAGSDDNHEKMYRSRSGLSMHFNDDRGVMTLATAAGNRIVLDDSERSLTLADQNGNKLVMGSDGILIESARTLALKAGSDAGLEAVDVRLEATGALKLEGSASAELKGGGIAKLSAALVQIN